MKLEDQSHEELVKLTEVDMCLGVPGRIIEIYEAGGLRMGRLDYGGIVKEACLAYVPEAQVGDYALVHVGFAISRLDEQEAMASLKTIREVADLETALGLNDGG